MQMRKSIVGLVTLSLIVTPLGPAIAHAQTGEVQHPPSVETGASVVETGAVLIEEEGVEQPVSSESTWSYPELMQRAQRLIHSSSTVLSDGSSDSPSRLRADIRDYTRGQEEKLKKLGVPQRAIDAHLKKLDAIVEDLSVLTSSQESDVLIPDQPSLFHIEDSEVDVQTVKKGEIQHLDLLEEWKPKRSLLEKIKIFFMPSAEADFNQALPVLADTQGDDKEIIMTDAIQALANELNRNPVNIVNFVREEIQFEPYSGAKKGAEGCLRDRVCNDTDTAALTIALLRSAGIPARFRKAAALFTREQAESLTGADNPKSAYVLFTLNDYPAYVIGSDLQDGGLVEEADFSGVTHFFVEWIGVELFIDYDERGGNISSLDDFSGATSDGDVADILLPYEKKTWLYVDPTLQETERTEMPLPGNTDAMQFLQDNLQTDGSQTPVENYSDTIGLDLLDPGNQTTITTVDPPYEILPPTPPYNLNEHEDITPEAWSSLPDNFRHKVIITITDEESSTDLLTHTLYGYEIQNQEYELTYEGETQTDKDAIEAFGGIHATPPSLVSIVPVISDGIQSIQGIAATEIGRTTTMSFTHSRRRRDQQIHDSVNQKYSVAGNREGIYMTLSQAYSDASRDTNELILLGGNESIARHFLHTVLSTTAQVSGVFDHLTTTHFARAVVTQNRVVDRIDGDPATFTFDGLTVDAHIALNPTSRRIDHIRQRYDLALLLAQDHSDYEARVFEELGGLDAFSSVRGLQYAYVNPGEYTVHTIDSGNESVIDTLNLTANTKANMHADVQAGATVITPDKLLSDGSFEGVAYISVSDTLMKFVIGEQVAQNGGFTFNTFSIIDPNTNRVILQNRIVYFFQETHGFESSLCNISQSEHDEMISLPGYDENAHGYPCLKKTHDYGTRQHTTNLTSKAVYFESSTEDYYYWQTAAEALMVLFDDKDLDREDESDVVTLSDDAFFFDPSSGTYAWNGTYTDVSNFSAPLFLKAFYQPLADERGRGRIVWGKILEKLLSPGYSCDPTLSSCSAESLVGREIGYPMGPRDWPNSFISNNFLQQFIGGTIFYVERPLARHVSDEYYTILPIWVELQNNGGTDVHGFPVQDPQPRFNPASLVQLFASGFEIKATFNGVGSESIPSEVTIQKGEALLDSEAFNEGFIDAYLENGIIGYAVDLYENPTTLKYAILGGSLAAAGATLYSAPQAGAVVLTVLAVGAIGVDVAIQAPKVVDARRICKADEDYQGQPANYYCGLALGLIMSFATDATLDIGGIKIVNALGTTSDAAKAAKMSFVKKVSKDSEVLKYIGRTRGKIYEFANANEIADDFFIRINNLTEAEIIAMGKDPKLVAVHFMQSSGDIEMETLGNLQRNDPRIIDQSIRHTILGIFENGKFKNGLHSPAELQRYIDVGAVTVKDLNNKIVTNVIDEVGATANGIRKVYVDGKPKTLFPHEATPQQIVTAMDESMRPEFYVPAKNSYIRDIDIAGYNLQIKVNMDAEDIVIGSFPLLP